MRFFDRLLSRRLLPAAPHQALPADAQRATALTTANRLDDDRHQALLTPRAHFRRRRSLLRRTGALLLRPQIVVATTAWTVDTMVLTATAAQIRYFPDNTQLGRIRFGHFPEATLNGKAIRLGVGVRILNQQNLVVPPASLLGKSHVVAYKTGALDEIVTIWILSDEEYRSLRKRRS
ncbi:MAG: hypothetical protein Q4B17_05695 [Lautropia sp.]|nr:hypothetical protein [Lautropia sp.]